MDKSEFFEKLIISLMKQSYKIDDQIFQANIEQAVKYNKTTAVKTNLALGAVEILSAIAGMDVSFGDVAVNPAYINDEEFMEDIEKLQLITPYILYKFVINSLNIVGLIDGDNLKTDEYMDITKQYDSNILNFRKYVGKVGGQKGGLYGLLFFVFSNVEKFNEFAQRHLEKSKISHFWKQTYIFPFGINISQKSIVKCKGLFDGRGVVNYKSLENDLFC